MEDEAILLKIKRQFSKAEAVAALLKIISDLQFEVGELKSEVSELKFRNHQLTLAPKIDGVKTKKEWLKDDIIAEMDKQLKSHQAKNTLCNKSLNEWRNKYFSISNQITNNG